MGCRTRALAATLGLATWFLLGAAAAAAQEGVVRGIFFYLPTCGHCHKVIQEDLPPIQERFGDSLQIAFVDASTEVGLQLFYDSVDTFGIPEEAQGVPLMVVGSEVMSGEFEIPERLAGVVEAGLAAGGVPWPPIPGIEAVMADAEALARETVAAPTVDPMLPLEATAAEVEEAVTEATEPADDAPFEAAPDFTPPTLGERWAADPVAFGITLVVLAVMVPSALYVAFRWWRQGLRGRGAGGWRGWVVPALCAIGVVVAAYLAYVETTSSEAVCGPVGDCNAVQASEYAKLFGVLPVGVLGLLGYVAIVALWAWGRYGPREQAGRTRWLLPAFVLFGVAFSIYLTLLELFVIHAICMWCVTSAVTMTLLLWAVYLGWVERPDEEARTVREAISA